MRKKYTRVVSLFAVTGLCLSAAYSPYTSLKNVYATNATVQTSEMATTATDTTETTATTTEIVNTEINSVGNSQSGTLKANNVYVRTGPGRSFPPVSSGGSVKLSAGATVTILGTETGTDTLYPAWYKISFSYNGAPLTGYIATSYITVYNTTTTTTDVTPGTSALDTNFEAQLDAQGFPESYKIYLRTLHAAHPNWMFTAIQTGLDWNTVIENERNKTGQVKNLVQGTSSAPHYNWRTTEVGYNWVTDSWSPYDGTSWYAASNAFVQYYMDPRNYLDENYIYAFENLSYVDGAQTQAGVETILTGSFMSNTIPVGSTDVYSKIMLNAGNESKVSPYHIASRIKQEIGTAVSESVSGTNATYPGIYNFYNIGASDSAGGGAVLKGLAFAATGSTYNRPWNTPYKSIVGGALYIGSNYILRGQSTLYTQKFNVTYTAALYGHQYMSNVQAAANEGYKVGTAYKNNGLANGNISFNIPVYNNMPATQCVKPADSGNPNNWLKSLVIKDCTITPTFGINAISDYYVIVPNTTAIVNISGTTVNANATISGMGDINLVVGTNEIPIKVTAQNGDVRNYNITIVRTNPDGSIPSNTSTTIFNTTYRINSNIITGFDLGSDVATVINKMGPIAGTTVNVYTADGVTPQTGKIGTGNVIKVSNGSTVYSYTAVVYGDVNGDGNVSALDLLKVQKHIIGNSVLTGPYLAAANVKKSGSVSALDLLKVQKHIIGANIISQ